MKETCWQRERRLGKEPLNPFSTPRRAKQSARYLNRREAAMHRETFDRAGNRREIRFDYEPEQNR